MNSDNTLLLLLGLACGFGVGYFTAWRFARKLEHHGVRLDKWDGVFDPQAPATEIKFPKQRA